MRRRHYPSNDIALRDGGLWLGKASIADLQYRVGRVHDEVDIDGKIFGVPSGKGAHVQRMVLRWRLGVPAALAPSMAIDAMDEALAAWLATWLTSSEENMEVLLAALTTSNG